MRALGKSFVRITSFIFKEIRELVRRRIGRLAGLIVGCDALVAWCSTLVSVTWKEADMLKIKRVYDPAERGDGERILVDRLLDRPRTLSCHCP